MDIRWLRILLRCPQLHGVKDIHLELEMETTRYDNLRQIVDRVSVCESERFKRYGAPKASAWLRPSSEVDGEGTAYSTIKLGWINTGISDQKIRRRFGCGIFQGQVMDYNPLKHKCEKVERKRGGRRGSPIWYQQHWRELDPRKEGTAANAAAEIIEKWETEGSLLRLV